MKTFDQTPVRVALNAYFWRHPLTGSGQYLTGLAGSLPAAAAGCLISFFEPNARGQAVRRPGPSEAGPEPSRTVALGLQTQPVSPLAKLYFEQVSLPLAVRGQAQVLHYPYWAAPLRCRVPTVVTVHDLIPLLLPAYRGPLLMRAYTKLVAFASQRATLLIADSNATKRDLVDHLHIPAERVRVIHLAASDSFKPNSDTACLAAVRERHGLREPYLFYVGGLDRRKNVERLIVAFAKAQRALKEERHHAAGGEQNNGDNEARINARAVLAIAGDVTRMGALFPDLPRTAREHGVADAVRFLGVVPAADLPGLYQAAEAVCFPSAYEGFGLPPLEALSCGAAVICSNASSLTEVVGDAAVTLDPDDEDAWAEAIARVLRDPDHEIPSRDELRRRGPEQAARFSWRKVAAETAAVYHEARARWETNPWGATCG